MVPSADFWAPFILPLYMKHLAQSFAGMGGGYVLECLLQGGLTLCLLTLLLGRRRHGVAVYLLGAMVVAMAMLPFNIGSVVMARSGSLVFAGVYNRLGGALIMLALLVPVVREDRSRDGLLMLWMACLLSLAFLVKVTVFQIVLVLGGGYGLLCKDWRWLRVMLMATVVSVALLAVLLLSTGMWDGYLSALREVSAVRMSLMHERLDISRETLVNHRLECFVLLFCGLLAAARGHFLRIDWAGLVLWYLLSCVMIILFMLTNFGDNGLFPSVGALFALVSLQSRAGLMARLASSTGRRYARALKWASEGVLALILVGYVVVNVIWGWSFMQTQQRADLIHFPVSTTFFSNHHLIEREAWESRIPLHVPGVPRNMQSPSTFADYVEGLDEAERFLEEHVPDRGRSVYALDFPSYVFAMAGGYRVPRGTYPWLLFGHELSIDVHPKAEVLLADVDVLMVSKCSLATGNRRYLVRLYRQDIERRWTRLGALRCWDVYRKR